ncbi:hypothetical protein ANN_07783 [Periplaneta americana]|uniref:Uncharacterized protein n=1 Tax=Periplaneta americana TaxID=6978 RepID=A0ABQ8T144_PERAM|nr:hypothetical protein ANN_07783 [Periplaneta americana]
MDTIVIQEDGVPPHFAMIVRDHLKIEVVAHHGFGFLLTRPKHLKLSVRVFNKPKVYKVKIHSAEQMQH